jgi:MFS family permease
VLALFVAGTIGVISPSGNEVGPFLSIEQAALSQVVPRAQRTDVFAWYTLTGAFATALGSLFAGFLVATLQETGRTALDSERAVFYLYALLGLALALLFYRLSPGTEAPAAIPTRWGLGSSRGPVLKLSSLFALDAFGGGFVVQSFAVYWFHLRFGVQAAALGGIFFGANLFAGISALLASRLVSRWGLVRTMVFTHLPSNVLLILVPLMPNLALAIAMLLLRFSISQMDVPTRQSYTMAIVRPEERSAAAGVTGVARTLGAAIAPTFAGRLFAQPSLISLPFYIAGMCKIVYDLLLYRAAAKLPRPEH